MGVLIKTNNGYESIIDDEDSWLAGFTWSVKKKTETNIYLFRSVQNGRGGRYTLYLHREIMGLRWGDRRMVDHINRDTLDNRRQNLRVCEGAENQRNRRLSKNNSTGVNGVCLASDGKYEAYIKVNGKTVYVGRASKIEDAAKMRDGAESELWGQKLQSRGFQKKPKGRPE